VGEYTTIAELLASCQAWFERTGREITLEYTLLRNVNDRPEHAEELARLAKTLRANVNLIRYNEVAGLPFKRPRTEDVRAFQEILRARRINSHIRSQPRPRHRRGVRATPPRTRARVTGAHVRVAAPSQTLQALQRPAVVPNDRRGVNAGSDQAELPWAWDSRSWI
jgi:hypothetical protein